VQLHLYEYSITNETSIQSGKGFKHFGDALIAQSRKHQKQTRKLLTLIFADERVGNLTIVVTDPTVFPAFFSQLAMIIRALWCVPQKRGAQIVHTILTTPKLRISWLDSVKVCAV
jgi:aspartate/tyrosine/aromatic aminotransferase